ncbi:hypothetical protein ACUODJ_04670, partial [Escherichia sp. HC-CC]
MEFAFYICGLIAILATLRVITHTNPVHALLTTRASGRYSAAGGVAAGESGIRSGGNRDRYGTLG